MCLVPGKAAERHATENEVGDRFRTESRRMIKTLYNKAAGESKPEAYPPGRTVRRIRSTKSVRTAEW